jgi:hypothetical protein
MKRPEAVTLLTASLKYLLPNYQNVMFRNGISVSPMPVGVLTGVIRQKIYIRYDYVPVQ